MNNVRAAESNIGSWTMTTADTEGILPVAGQVDFLILPRHEENAVLWDRINKERWRLNLEVCYCSLLENCYITDRPGKVQEVEQCP
jgi:hypothetical protein